MISYGIILYLLKNIMILFKRKLNVLEIHLNMIKICQILINNKNIIQDINILKILRIIFFLNIAISQDIFIKECIYSFEKRETFLLRLYAGEIDFFGDINKDLTNFHSFGPYKIFVLILFYSIQNKSLNSYVKKKII